MKCELNIKGGAPVGHEAHAAWRAENKYGARFNLCESCALTYKKNNPDWKKRGMRIEPIEPPPLMMAIPFHP